MKLDPAVVLAPLILCFVLASGASLADQTDPRLDDLFKTLHSEDRDVRARAEGQIWEIWFDSGDDQINALMRQGSEAEQLGRSTAAIAFYSEVIERAPEYSEGWNRRATMRYHRGDYGGSLADIQRVMQLEPRHFGALWGRGMILGAQGQYSAAIVAFERLLEIKPNAVDARARLEQLKKEWLKGTV